MELSIVIPAFNEEDYLGHCCKSIFDVLKDFNISYEILVINNGSTDNTGLVASSFAEIKTIEIDRTSVAEARNIGVKYTTGRLLAFIDADVVLERKWGFRINQLCRNSVGLFVTGFQYGIRKNPSWVEKYWFKNMRSSHINAGNLICSRSAFDELGGFDTGFKTGEDVDFCRRAQSNYRITYEPDSELQSIHLGYPRNIKSFIKREYWHGEGDFRSFDSFRKSKIAILAVIYGLAHLMIIWLLLNAQYLELVLSVALLVIVNLIISLLKFPGSSMRIIFYTFILNYFYLMARFFSLFKAIKNRSKSY